MEHYNTPPLSISLVGNLENASWVAHYMNFCYPNHTWILFEIEKDFYGVGPKILWNDKGNVKPQKTISLTELRKSFNTEMLEEVNWKGAKHEFWSMVLCRINKMEDKFSAFLEHSEFPIHKVQTYLHSKENK